LNLPTGATEHSSTKAAIASTKFSNRTAS
jgi:hypothetical protein